MLNQKKERAAQIITILSQQYADADTELNFNSVFELAIAVILSAQCTDKRVNKVTEQLFKQANTPQQFLQLGKQRLEQLIFSCGFYKNKAANILKMCQDLIEKYDGQLPNTEQELVKLAGIGKKTAAVIFSVGFGGDAIAVDTHIFRVSKRLGLSDAKTPEQTQKQLMQLLDKSIWSRAHHYLLFQGRYTCTSQKPKCNQCQVTQFCVKDAQAVKNDK